MPATTKTPESDSTMPFLCNNGFFCCCCCRCRYKTLLLLWERKREIADKHTNITFCMREREGEKATTRKRERLSHLSGMMMSSLQNGNRSHESHIQNKRYSSVIVQLYQTGTNFPNCLYNLLHFKVYISWDCTVEKNGLWQSKGPHRMSQLMMMRLDCLHECLWSPHSGGVFWNP